MPISISRALSAIIPVLCLSPLAAQGAGPAGEGDDAVTIVVAPPVVHEDAGPGLRRGIQEAARTAPSRAGARTIVLAADRCEATDLPCLNQATAEHGRWLLRINVAASGPDSLATVEVVDVETGSAFVSLSSTCEICGEAEAIQGVEDLIAQAARRLTVDATPARVEIVGDPARVDLFIDGESVGVAPFDAEIPPGKHEVTVVRAGYQPQLLRWEAEPGVATRLSYALVPLAEGPTAEQGDCADLLAPETTDPKVHKRRVALGGTSLGLGLAGVAAGATLLALDGEFQKSSCDASTRDPNGLCPRTWSNTLPGALGVGIGSALTGLGVGLLISELRKSKRRAADHARAKLRSRAM